MKSILLLLLVLILSAGCGSGFEVTKSRNPNNPDLVTYNSSRLSVRSEHETQSFYTYLQFSCFDNMGDRTYSISSSYVTYTWPFFQKVKFFIDGYEKEIVPDRPPVREVEGVTGPTETITVQVPESLIIDLYESMEARMKVIGPEIKYDIYFTDGMKLNLFNFYKETIK